MIRTNVEIDEALIKEAMALSKLTTKKAVINEAPLSGVYDPRPYTTRYSTFVTSNP